LGSRDQTPMSLEDAISSLVAEATPPDLARKAQEV
jgi:threonyl-tRNA synthetase